MTESLNGGTGCGVLHFGYDFNPPPGPGGFGGAPPPPPPGHLQPTPLGPPPKRESPTWLYFLLGCGCLLVISVVGFVGCGAYMVAKLPQLMAGAAKLGKSEYMAQLSPDHTDDQKARFEAAFDALNQDTAAYDSFVDYIDAPNQPLYDSLNGISADGEITVDESQDWAASVESALGGDSSSEYGEDQPAGDEGGTEPDE